MKRILLALLTLVLLHFEIGLAQSTDFPNVLDKGGIQVLCKSAASVSAPADATEDTLATCTVPANAIGANGILRVTALLTVTNSVNNKTLRIRFSGGAGTIFNSGVVTAVASIYRQFTIANRNATNSQVGMQNGNVVDSFGSSTNAVTTGAIDTTAATTLLITCQKATAGEACTLESFLVELMPSN